MTSVSGITPTPRHINGVLNNYFRARVKNEVYPGIYPRITYQVSGILYFDIPPAAIIRLDQFEGETYFRQEVEVTSEDRNSHQAVTYVVKPQYISELLDVEWKYEIFLQHGKKCFVNTYDGFDKIDTIPPK